MAKQWKKIILSGSDAHLASITSSGGIHAVGSLGISASVIHLFNGDGTGGSFTSASLAGAGGGASTATQIPMGRIPQPFPGFFDTFLTSTTVAETIEEISTAFVSIAPAQPQGLTGANLNKSLPNNSNTFTGLLAGGLDTNHWNGLTAHSSYTFHKSADIRLTTPDGTGTTNRRFRAGKYANLFPCDATLLKAYVRISTPDATADLTMALDYRVAGSTTTVNRGTLLKEIASTDDAKVIFYDWGGTLTSGVNTVPAGAMVGIGLTGESTGLMGNEYINVTTVWELDYSTELTASIG